MSLVDCARGLHRSIPNFQFIRPRRYRTDSLHITYTLYYMFTPVPLIMVSFLCNKNAHQSIIGSKNCLRNALFPSLSHLGVFTSPEDVEVGFVCEGFELLLVGGRSGVETGCGRSTAWLRTNSESGAGTSTSSRELTSGPFATRRIYQRRTVQRLILESQ